MGLEIHFRPERMGSRSGASPKYDLLFGNTPDKTSSVANCVQVSTIGRVLTYLGRGSTKHQESCVTLPGGSGVGHLDGGRPGVLTQRS